MVKKRDIHVFKCRIETFIKIWIQVENHKKSGSMQKANLKREHNFVHNTHFEYRDILKCESIYEFNKNINKAKPRSYN